MSRRVVFVGGAVLVTLGLGYGASYDWSGQHVLRGVSLGSVDLSGDTRERARTSIHELVDAASRSSFALDADGSGFALPVAETGLGVAVDQTVDRALRASLWDRLRAAMGHRRQVEPVVTGEPERLRGALEAVARRFDRRAHEGTVAFVGVRPVEVEPVRGQTLQVQDTAQRVRAAFPASLQVRAVVQKTATKTSAADVKRALEQVVTPALAAPIILSAGPHPLLVEPRDLARALTFEAEDSGELRPRIGKAALVAALGGRLAAARPAPTDAGVDVSSGSAMVVAARDGAMFTDDALVTAVSDLLTAASPRSGRLPATITKPRLSTEVVASLGIKQMIGTFTTRHPCCAPRVANIHAVAKIVDGSIVLPGQTFSLNALVGKRDTARGFVRAPQIEDGQFTYAIGGGISQFATTMFNAVFFSGLKDVQHVPHSFYIKRYPPGRESTVSYPQPDFRFQNDTATGVLIKASFTDTSITVTFWGTKKYDISAVEGPRTRVLDFGTEYITRPDCIKGDGEIGFDIEVTRVFALSGVVVRRQVFKTRYLPEPRFVCGPDPAAPASPSAAPTS